MSKELIARIRKNREVKVKVSKWTFLVCRPTDVEAVALYRGGMAYADIAQHHVIGWEGVTEDDIVGGGTADPLPFDSMLWQEWCADRSDFWEPIATAAMNAYEEHTIKIGESVKK